MRLVRLFVLCSLLASLFPMPRAATAAAASSSGVSGQDSQARPASPDPTLAAGAAAAPGGVRLPAQTRSAADTLSRENFEQDFSLHPPPATGLHVEQDVEP